MADARGEHSSSGAGEGNGPEPATAAVNGAPDAPEDNLAPQEPPRLSLQGRRIGVTRADQQLGEARRLFEATGATVIDLPALAVTPPDDWGPLDDALAELEDFHWIVFSSANGVEAVERRLSRRGSSLAHRPAGLRIAAVGRKTASVVLLMG
jgi:uroporphyrinogen-III synthase